MSGPDIDCKSLKKADYTKSTDDFHCESTSTPRSGLSTGGKVGVSVGVSLGVMGLLGVSLLYKRKRR